MPLPAILDVDTGVDDALAIVFASASPELELRGITCVAGNTELPDVVDNTSALLTMLGRTDVPLAVGAVRPLLRAPVGRDNAIRHGGHGRGYAGLPPTGAKPIAADASQLIIDEARACDGELTLIATGPLTNVAIAARREPRLPELVRQLVVMGGAFRCPGNITPVAEFNIQADAEAAKIVFDAFRGCPRRPLVLGLDVTYQVRLESSSIEEIASRAGDAITVAPGSEAWGAPGTPLVAYLVDALRYYADWHLDAYGFYGSFMHDPLTVAVALDPTLVTTSAVAVDVECRGELTTGQTVVDWDGVWDIEPNVDVALGIDTRRALEQVVERVGAATAHAAAVHPDA
jgi:purine nucleosidase